MPARYEAMRDKFEEQGMSEKSAKGKAARIFNGTRKKGEAPVTGKKDAYVKGRGKKNPFAKVM